MSVVQSLMAYLLLIVFSVGAILLVSSRLGRRRLTPEKDIPYECGMDPKVEPESRFPVRFYKIAILFVVFDVEMVFLLLWAVALKGLGTAGLLIMFVFIAVLLAAWVYVRLQGDLQWD